MVIRIGQGVDIHQLKEGLPLWLGGVNIPSPHGAVAHSDGDVLLHAICDALLGAAALGDIGKHFPDNDSRYKGIDSKILLKEVSRLISDAGFRVVNIDSTVLLEEPKIAPWVGKICDTISDILEIEKDSVSVKATTTERMGFTGRNEGVMAMASALLQKI